MVEEDSSWMEPQLRLMPSGTAAELEAEVPPAKRQKKKTKEYLPGVGTANYAFMIALFQAGSSSNLCACCLRTWRVKPSFE